MFAEEMLSSLGIEGVQGQAVFTLHERKVLFWNDKVMVLKHCANTTVAVPHHQMLGRKRLELDCPAVALTIVHSPRLTPMTSLRLALGRINGS